MKFLPYNPEQAYLLPPPVQRLVLSGVEGRCGCTLCRWDPVAWATGLDRWKWMVRRVQFSGLRRWGHGQKPVA